MSEKVQGEPRRVAVVTGASQGIGAAITHRLARGGYLVWAAARRARELRDVAAAGPPDAIRPFPLDILTPDLAVLERALTGEGYHLDALVHCAGAIATGPLLDAGTKEAPRLMDVNAMAPLRLTTHLRHLLGPGSTIVFVNSTQGLTASGSTGAYAASKHALKAIADAMRSDLSGSGIRVTSIYPGRTATPMQEKLYAERGELYCPERLLQPEVIADVVHNIVTLPVGAEITDITIRTDTKSY